MTQPSEPQQWLYWRQIIKKGVC